MRHFHAALLQEDSPQGCCSHWSHPAELNGNCKLLEAMEESWLPIIYDVFISESALGNPCAVVELDVWPDYECLLAETQQLGQPVTSFVLAANEKFYIRWFSQHSEINLCGHGSLGAGAAVLNKYQQSTVVFHSQHGDVEIAKLDDGFGITLPAWQACKPSDDTSDLVRDAEEVFATRDLVFVLTDAEAVKAFQPDFTRFIQINDYHAVIVTAQSGESEYVLRYFAPKIAINEDQATGSAHCSLAPYWFDRLNADKLTARQLSPDGGYFTLHKKSDSLIQVCAQVKENKVIV